MIWALCVVLAFSGEALAGYANPIAVPGAYWLTTNLDTNNGFRHDILASGIHGKPVYAIEDGTIQCKQILGTNGGYKGKLVSYGNVVYFTSSDGKTTARYAHLSDFAHCSPVVTISAGEGSTYTVAGSDTRVLGTYYVTKGEVVGYVGTTGNSSGSHLHFELRINGVQVAPEKYVSINGTTTIPSSWVEVGAENFPDANFRSYISSNIDTNKDGYLSDSEIASVTSISVNGRSISDLTGIKKFKNLNWLECQDNKIKTLNLSGMTKLISVWCWNNGMTSLNVSGCTALPELWAYNNSLTSLNVNNCTALRVLQIYNNSFTALTISSLPNLETLNLYNCKLLKKLNCASNNLTTLNLQSCMALVGEGRDEDLVEVVAGEPVTFEIENLKSDEVEIYINDELIEETFEISDEATFTLPADMIDSDFRIFIKAGEATSNELHISVLE